MWRGRTGAPLHECLCIWWAYIHPPEASDLLLVLPDRAVPGILVDDGLVLDALGTVSVPQRGERLVVVPVGGADVGEHAALVVAAERVLEQPRQLRVAVGDVGPLVHQRTAGETGGPHEPAAGGQAPSEGPAETLTCHLITLPSAVRLRLMLTPSLNRVPSAPVFPARSEPAKSTCGGLADTSVTPLLASAAPPQVVLRGALAPPPARALCDTGPGQRGASPG